MPEIQLVSPAGYDALGALADSDPQLFTQGNAAQLRQHMERSSPEADLYGEWIPMQASLDRLNCLETPGPETDSEFAPAIREALGSSVVQAANHRLWATINCFELPHYVRVRWRSSNRSESGSTGFVDSHWLRYGGANGRKWNAAARLWWLGEMAARAAEHSQHSEDELLVAMAGNVNLYHQTVDRTFLSANPRLLAAVWDTFLDGNNHLGTTKNASAMMMALNLRAATLSFDFLDYNELREVVEEAKPKKET